MAHVVLVGEREPRAQFVALNRLVRRYPTMKRGRRRLFFLPFSSPGAPHPGRAAKDALATWWGGTWGGRGGGLARPLVDALFQEEGPRGQRRDFGAHSPPIRANSLSCLLFACPWPLGPRVAWGGWPWVGTAAPLLYEKALGSPQPPMAWATVAPRHSHGHPPFPSLSPFPCLACHSSTNIHPHTHRQQAEMRLYSFLVGASLMGSVVGFMPRAPVQRSCLGKWCGI